jgi:outer membrane protein OmpA-like peptidoglycan-associated protein
VEGHTDNVGAIRMNEQLSIDRAVSVESAIRQRIFWQGMIIVTRGWGDRLPVADNNTPEGRQLNRRVELYVYTKE